jgi:hypothetical protein
MTGSKSEKAGRSGFSRDSTRSRRVIALRATSSNPSASALPRRPERGNRTSAKPTRATSTVRFPRARSPSAEFPKTWRPSSLLTTRASRPQRGKTRRPAAAVESVGRGVIDGHSRRIYARALNHRAHAPVVFCGDCVCTGGGDRNERRRNDRVPLLRCSLRHRSPSESAGTGAERLGFAGRGDGRDVKDGA